MLKLIALLKELFTPTNKTGPAHEIYDKSAQGVYHMVLGAGFCFASIFFGFPLSPLTIALIYYLKEIIDLSNHGEFADGIEDTICVFIGALAYSTIYWPFIFLAVGIAILVKETFK